MSRRNSGKHEFILNESTSDWFNVCSIKLWLILIRENFQNQKTQQLLQTWSVVCSLKHVILLPVRAAGKLKDTGTKKKLFVHVPDRRNPFVVRLCTEGPVWTEEGKPVRSKVKHTIKAFRLSWTFVISYLSRLYHLLIWQRLVVSDWLSGSLTPRPLSGRFLSTWLLRCWWRKWRTVFIHSTKQKCTAAAAILFRLLTLRSTMPPAASTHLTPPSFTRPAWRAAGRGLRRTVTDRTAERSQKSTHRKCRSLI